MSVRVNNQFARNKYSAEKKEKKFCGVCHKAGLSEKDYTSHFTKSTPGPHGIVTCPTILNNECSFCFQFGHFKSACPAIAAKEKREKKISYEERRHDMKRTASVAATKPKPESINRFSALHIDSDEEVAPVCGKRKNATTDAIIAGPKPVDVKPMDTTKPSFAAMLTREAPKVVEEESIETLLTVLKAGWSSATIGSTAAGSTQNRRTRQMMSWVESDDEEDEEW
jgi:hypothetical protein